MTPPEPLPTSLESSYYATQGFDPDHARFVRSHYLPFVRGRTLLLELGCGRGEFLEVAAPEVGRVLGVDVDPEMVAQARAAGFEAVERDVLTFLAETDERPDAVFLAHLIEHLAVEDAYAMLRQAATVMPPGAVLIVVTPNPACLANLTNDFWSDPTHVRLYTLELLSFLLQQAGFDVIEAAGNPRDIPGAPPEIAAPPAIEPWGDEGVLIDPPPAIDYDESLRLEGVLEELSRLRRAVEGLVHIRYLQDERLFSLRHFVETVAERHDAALAHLWGPNEIYVVGERRR